MSARPARSVRALPGLLAALLLVPVLAACSPEQETAETVIRPVKVVEVARSDSAERLVFSGTVKARTEMNLGFRIAGKIVSRSIDIGDRVEPGTPLMSLDAADIELAIDRAKADLAAADRQFATASAAFERARTLLAGKTIARAEFEGRELSYEQARSQLASAQSALAQTENQRLYAKLVADKAGVVTAVNADVGQVVGAGNVVVTIAAEGEKEVAIAVPETEIARLKPGQTVTARFWADSGLTLDGTVREIAASADPVSRTFAVRISLPSEPRALIGMTATIEARIARPGSGFALPIAALAEQDGKPVVWLVDPATGTVSARQVSVTGYDERGAIIGAGLSEGDLVVAAGTQFMTEKLKVRLEAGLTARSSAAPQG